ncbi:MAG: trigger factor [Candidatus Kapabacteria bacterium]|nr:trigger factor [Candidatus Kapabacteria bacterium]
MEKNYIEHPGNERELIITLSDEEILPHFEKALRDIQPDLEIKGFRKGKVPISVIKQRFGASVEADTIEKLLSEEFSKIIKEDNLNVVGQPVIKSIDKENGNTKASIVFEVFQEIEIKDYHGLQINEPFHKVTDEEIEHEIYHILINNGDIVEDEEILSDLHLVDVTIREIDPETNLHLLGSKPEKTQIFLHSHTIIPELRNLMMNKRVGDTFRFKPSDFDQYAPNKVFEFTVDKINKIVPKELTDEFVKEYTREKLQTVDEFKDDIGFQIQERWNQKSREEMENQIMNKLVEMNDFDPPTSVVINVAQSLFENFKKQYGNNLPPDVTFDDMRDDLIPIAKNQVKWAMIREEIIKKEGLKVEDYDIEPIAQMESDRLQIDLETTKNNLMKNSRLVDAILSKKVFDLIIDFAETTEVPFEEGHHDHDLYDDYEDEIEDDESLESQNEIDDDIQDLDKEEKKD